MKLNSKIMDGVERLRRFRNSILKHPHICNLRDKIALVLETIGAMPPRDRVATAVLTNAGIRFMNMRFHDETVTGPLLDDLIRGAKKRFRPSIENTPPRIKVIVRFNPDDVGSIAVWNPAAKRYVTLPNREPIVCDWLSFRHGERTRESASRRHLDFSSEAERLRVRNALLELLEELPIDKD
jgi:hypothetical protein